MPQEDPRYRRIDRVLARAYIKLLLKWSATKKRVEAGFLVPRMNLCDDPESTHIVATLEVPGMRREELLLQVKDSRLVIEGERVGPHPLLVQTPQPTTATVSEAPTPPSLYPVRELKYGRIKREIDLPLGINVTQVDSTLTEGILTISWPRTATSREVAGESTSRVAAHDE